MTNWNYNEDDYCSEQFIKKYIIDKEYFPYQTLAYNISLKLKNLTEESIRMKISNIVYIANYLKIKHTCDIAPLCNYSQQNLVTFVQHLLKNKISVDRNLVEKIIKETLIEARKFN